MKAIVYILMTTLFLFAGCDGSNSQGGNGQETPNFVGGGNGFGEINIAAIECSPNNLTTVPSGTGPTELLEINVRLKDDFGNDVVGAPIEVTFGFSILAAWQEDEVTGYNLGGDIIISEEGGTSVLVQCDNFFGPPHTNPGCFVSFANTSIPNNGTSSPICGASFYDPSL